MQETLLDRSITITVLAAVAIFVNLTLVNDRFKGWFFVVVMLVWIFCQGPGALFYLLLQMLE